MKNRKSIQRILSAATAVILMIAFAIPAGSYSRKQKTDYPFILVHGLFGWGSDEGINDDLPYWGATTGSLTEYLTSLGYETHDASVGPMSSTWDRACELYAQLTGTTVDYGEFHARQMGHARYGRTYSEPLIEGWGDKDDSGNIKKINLVGHSFGGTTIRLLTYLLDKGNADEQNTTPEAELSPLFKGGNKQLVHSVTAIATPHNSSMTYVPLADFGLLFSVTALAYTYAEVISRTRLNGYVDFHLEQFGLSDVPGEAHTDFKGYRQLREIIKLLGNDSAEYDLCPEGTQKINNMIEITDSVYYFSVPYSTTKKSRLFDTYRPILSTNPILLVTAFTTGIARTGNFSGIEFDKAWRENDGLVSTISAKHPFDEPWTDYDINNIQSGIWNVFPTKEGDHGKAIGLLADRDKTRSSYRQLFNMICSLPAVHI